MIIKNLKKYFTFEVQVLDDKNVRRRFRASNYQVCHCSLCWSEVARFIDTDLLQSTTRVKPFICTMPMRLDDGWNQVCSVSPIFQSFESNNLLDPIQSFRFHSPSLRNKLH